MAGEGRAKGDARRQAPARAWLRRNRRAKDFVVGDRPGAEVLAPAIGVGNRFIERAMRMVQPGRARIVEVGKGALGQFLGGIFFDRSGTL
jgi:hypothetical protein